MRYTLGIALTQRGSNVFSGSVSIDNANANAKANEHGERGTSNRFSGDLTDTRATVRLTNCTAVTS